MSSIYTDHHNEPSSSIQVPQIQRNGETRTQTIARLAAEVKVAYMAKTHAERKLIEFKDQCSQREILYDIATQQCETAWETMAEYKKQLSAQDIVIKKLKEDAKDYPHSNSSLLKSHQQLSEIIDTIRECLSCPLCYENFHKRVAVSLRCGHTFCQSCIDAWAATTNEQADSTTGTRTRMQPINRNTEAGGEEQGKLVQCPECRSNGTSRIRLYMLEEAIRIVERAQRQRQSTLLEESRRRLDLESIDLSKPIPPTDYLAD